MSIQEDTEFGVMRPWELKEKEAEEKHRDHHSLREIGPRCEVCGYPFAERHHALPKKYGGSDVEDNLVLLCPNHHKVIHFLVYMEILMSRKRTPSRPTERLARLQWLLWVDGEVHHFYEDRIKPIVYAQLERRDHGD